METVDLFRFLCLSSFPFAQLLYRNGSDAGDFVCFDAGVWYADVLRKADKVRDWDESFYFQEMVS